MMGRGGAGQGGSQKSKPILAPPHGVGLKSHPIPASPPLWAMEKPCGMKRGGTSQAGQGKIAISSCRCLKFDI